MMMSKRPVDFYAEKLLLSKEHRIQIEKIARKYTRGSPIPWEDAFQTAEMKIIEAVKAGRFRQGEIEDFYRWASVVAKYEIIDFIRRESRRSCQSLDELIPGTNVSVLDNISDEFNLLDVVERADIVVKAIEAIFRLDKSYPQRGYLKLWQGMIENKKQTQLAFELGIGQPEISKRWKEMVGRIAEDLGLCQAKKVRRRSQVQW